MFAIRILVLVLASYEGLLSLGLPTVPAGAVGTLWGTEKQNLDKSWISGVPGKTKGPQVPFYKGLTGLVSFTAERTGFEPAVRFNPYIGLANRRFRPLSHLSGSGASGVGIEPGAGERHLAMR